jgi:hypothetical protein
MDVAQLENDPMTGAGPALIVTPKAPLSVTLVTISS